MRNIFDQYSQPENRVTHALVAALHADRTLLKSFLRDLLRIHPETSPRKLHLTEQSYPQAPELSEEEASERGVPDAWIYDDDGWCVIIESKVLAEPNAEQIRRHIHTAQARGFTQITAVLISIRNFRKTPPRNITIVPWCAVYEWLRNNSSSTWATRVAQFLEVTEDKLIAQETGQLRGALTKFSGFYFGPKRPFTYLEAKRILRLAMNELAKDKKLQKALDVDPALGGRGAITGKADDVVWDYLQLRGAKGVRKFTKWPHLTLGLRRNTLEVFVTIPNSVDRKFQRELKELGHEKFQLMIKEILSNMRSVLRLQPSAAPILRGVQRRYKARNSIPTIDAELTFDIRTAFPGKHSVKQQPEWITAIYQALLDKRSNYQLQVGIVFPYEACPKIQNPGAIRLVADSWVACAPILQIANRLGK